MHLERRASGLLKRKAGAVDILGNLKRKTKTVCNVSDYVYNANSVTVWSSGLRIPVDTCFWSQKQIFYFSFESIYLFSLCIFASLLYVWFGTDIPMKLISKTIVPA